MKKKLTVAEDSAEVRLATSVTTLAANYCLTHGSVYSLETTLQVLHGLPLFIN